MSRNHDNEDTYRLMERVLRSWYRKWRIPIAEFEDVLQSCFLKYLTLVDVSLCDEDSMQEFLNKHARRDNRRRGRVQQRDKEVGRKRAEERVAKDEERRKCPYALDELRELALKILGDSKTADLFELSVLGGHGAITEYCREKGLNRDVVYKQISRARKKVAEYANKQGPSR